MLKKTIKFIGYDEKEATEVWYFNLNEAEVTRLDAEFQPGLGAYVENFDENTTAQEMLTLFERLIQMSVGTRSSDGTRFIKNQEVVDDFLASAAYSALFSELATSTDNAVEFFNGVLGRTFIEPKSTG